MSQVHFTCQMTGCSLPSAWAQPPCGTIQMNEGATLFFSCSAKVGLYAAEGAGTKNILKFSSNHDTC